MIRRHTDTVLRLQRKWMALTPQRKLLCVEAALELGRARLETRWRRFEHIWRRLQNPPSNAPDRTPSAKLLDDMAWTVPSVARQLPWRALCLEQALATYRMLRRRGVESEIKLGVRPSDHEGFEAHAWVLAGSRIVVGGSTSTSFAELPTQDKASSLL